MLAGAIRGWWLYAQPGRIRELVSLGLWLFFVENALFPNQHQEYGVLSLRDYFAGHTTAEPQLLDFAAAQGSSPTEFMLPVPSWVHPAWMIGAGLLALLVARKVTGIRWAATTIAATYLAYRGLAWLGLVAMGFPPSVPPVVLLAGALLVDLAVTARVAGWLAGPVVVGVVYGLALGLDQLDLLPPWNWWSVLPVAVGFAALWVGVDRLARSDWLARWRAPVAEPAPVPAVIGSAPGA
jgi:hypothetical protein